MTRRRCLPLNVHEKDVEKLEAVEIPSCRAVPARRRSPTQCSFIQFLSLVLGEMDLRADSLDYVRI